jgi:hypothetical protein
MTGTLRAVGLFTLFLAWLGVAMAFTRKEQDYLEKFREALSKNGHETYYPSTVNYFGSAIESVKRRNFILVAYALNKASDYVYPNYVSLRFPDDMQTALSRIYTLILGKIEDEFVRRLIFTIFYEKAKPKVDIAQVTFDELAEELPRRTEPLREELLNDKDCFFAKGFIDLCWYFIVCTHRKYITEDFPSKMRALKALDETAAFVYHDIVNLRRKNIDAKFNIYELDAFCSNTPTVQIILAYSNPNYMVDRVSVLDRTRNFHQSIDKAWANIRGKDFKRAAQYISLAGSSIINFSLPINFRVLRIYEEAIITMILSASDSVEKLKIMLEFGIITDFFLPSNLFTFQELSQDIETIIGTLYPRFSDEYLLAQMQLSYLATNVMHYLPKGIDLAKKFMDICMHTDLGRMHQFAIIFTPLKDELKKLGINS